MMDAEKWKDTILAKSREYVEIGVSVASDLTEKGRTQARILSNQAKIGKAQRQLGALVYSLAKGNEENQPLVDKYIDMIDSIEQENRQLKAKLTPPRPPRWRTRRWTPRPTWPTSWPTPSRKSRKHPPPGPPPGRTRMRRAKNTAPSAAQRWRPTRCSAPSAAHSSDRP